MHPTKQKIIREAAEVMLAAVEGQTVLRRPIEQNVHEIDFWFYFDPSHLEFWDFNEYKYKIAPHEPKEYWGYRNKKTGEFDCSAELSGERLPPPANQNYEVVRLKEVLIDK